MRNCVKAVSGDQRKLHQMDWCFCPVEVAGFVLVLYVICQLLLAWISVFRCPINQSLASYTKSVARKKCRKRHWMFWPVNDFGRWTIEIILACGLWVTGSRWESQGTTKNIFLLCYTRSRQGQGWSCLVFAAFDFPLLSHTAACDRCSHWFNDGPLSSWGKWPLEFRGKIMILFIKQAGVGGWAVHAGGESSKGTCLEHERWQEVCLAAGEKNWPCVWKEQRKRD